MATTFKTLGAKDVTSTRSLLHEAIPITGSIVSGTYIENPGGTTETNIKNYTHGMFQSVYDYAYLSSSANHIFDLTMGYSATSALSASTAVTQQSKKINVYNQMAQVLMGFDHTGSVHLFDEDGDLSGGTKMRECFFVNFARLLTKDEIKKGSFTLTLGVSGTYNQKDAFNERVSISDTGASSDFKVNSPAGEYGILYATNAAGTELINPTGGAKAVKAGLIYYQAGIAVVTGSVFGTLLSSSLSTHGLVFGTSAGYEEKVNAILTGSSISGSCNDFRHRVENLSFNNTTELNSTIYFCRANNNDFNYSANPTYLSASKIRVKDNSSDPPVSYITTVGLYSPDNELLAVAKVSEPLKKDPTDEFTLRVRLDY
jgi:hypothetical protein|tara:strand:+ start:2281 stop:3396 length:1116 start_codon:yes stop_codon:yes gene_type:complete